MEEGGSWSAAGISTSDIAGPASVSSGSMNSAEGGLSLGMYVGDGGELVGGWGDQEDVDKSGDLWDLVMDLVVLGEFVVDLLDLGEDLGDLEIDLRDFSVDLADLGDFVGVQGSLSGDGDSREEMEMLRWDLAGDSESEYLLGVKVGEYSATGE